MRTGKRLAPLLVMVVAALALVAPRAAFATSSTGSPSNYSFYPTASAAAIYVDNLIAANKADEVQITSVGEAAGAAGYVDVDVLDTTVAPEDGWKTYIQSAPSQNTVSYSYDAYESAASAANGGGTENVADYIIEYGRFGRLLSQLGLDNTGDSGISDPSRVLMGNLLQGTWYLANGADNAMGWCLNILQTLNPFRLIGNTLVGQGGDWTGHGATLDNQSDEGSLSAWIDANSSGDAGLAGEGATGDESWMAGSAALKSILSFVNAIYNFCYNNAWMVIIPLFVVLLIWLLVMTNSRRHAWSLGKRVIMIVALVAFLIPAWGVGYTAVLDGMIDAYNEQDNVSPANRAVLSTLVDTAGWARTGYDTTGIGLKSAIDGATGLPTDQPSADSVNNIRDITLKINELVANHEHDSATANYLSQIGATDNTMDVNGENTGALVMNDDEVDGAENAEAAAQRLLTSFIEGDKYEAAQYESYVKGADMDSNAFAEWLQATSDPEAFYTGLSTVRNSGGSNSDSDSGEDKGLLTGVAPGRADSTTNNEQLQKLLSELSALMKERPDPDTASAEEIAEWEQKYHELMDKIAEDEDNSSDQNGGNGQEDGAQTVDGIQWLGTAATGGSTKETVPDGDLNVDSDGTWSGSLSAIGTYNFLNTRFDSNGFTVYSSARSANTQSRVSHYATSLAGGSVLGLLLGANAIVLMLAFGITAIVYGLSLLFNNVKRSLTLVVQTPFAMLGAMGSLARVLLVGIMMIVEIVATVVLYTIMRSMLFVINDFLVSGIGGALGSVVPATTALFAPLMVIISIGLLLFYIVLAIRLRGALTAAIDEAISNVLNRILGTQVADRPSHALGKMAQGALVGGALMGGAGGASGALLGGTMLGAAGSALAHTPDPMGRSESINGDVIGDANASQSNVTNDAKSESTTQAGDTANNNLDKTAGAATMFAGAHGIEGMARQAGQTLMTGTVDGSLAGVGEGAGLSETMRESNEDLGSANRLEQSAFGRDTYLDDDQLGDTTMRAEGDVTAGDVDASAPQTTSLPGQRGIDGVDATDGMVGSESYVDASMASMAAPLAADGSVPTFLGGDAYANSDALTGDQFMQGGVNAGDVNSLSALGPEAAPAQGQPVMGDVFAEPGMGTSPASTVNADLSQTAMNASMSDVTNATGVAGTMDAYAAEYAGVGQGVPGMSSATPTALGGGADGGEYDLGGGARGVAASFEGGDQTTMNVAGASVAAMSEARRAADAAADAVIMPSASMGADVAQGRLHPQLGSFGERSLGASTSFGSGGYMGDQTTVDASRREGAQMSSRSFDQSRREDAFSQTQMAPAGTLDPHQSALSGASLQATQLGGRTLGSQGPQAPRFGAVPHDAGSLGRARTLDANGGPQLGQQGSVFAPGDVGMRPADGSPAATRGVDGGRPRHGSDAEMRPRQA